MASADSRTAAIRPSPNNSEAAGSSHVRISRLLAEAAACPAECAPELEAEEHRVSALRNQLNEGRFHLAVLGLFKRGKSTLLNALLGEPLLPAYVVPLTAVPIFIRSGRVPRIRISIEDGQRVREFDGKTTEDRAALEHG